MASESLKVSLERPQIKTPVKTVEKIIKKPVKKPSQKPKPKKIVPKPLPRPEPKKILAVPKVPEVVVEEETIHEQPVQERPLQETPTVAVAPSQATIDEIDAYEAYLRDVIYSKKIYPIKSRRMHQEGMVKIRFIVNEYGKITTFKILESSGFNTLDEAAEKLFERIGTFKPPPKAMPTPKELVITIQYTLQ
jgi:protein TonB